MTTDTLSIPVSVKDLIAQLEAEGYIITKRTTSARHWSYSDVHAFLTQPAKAAYLSYAKLAWVLASHPNEHFSLNGAAAQTDTDSAHLMSGVQHLGRYLRANGLPVPHSTSWQYIPNEGTSRENTYWFDARQAEMWLRGEAATRCSDGI